MHHPLLVPLLLAASSATLVAQALRDPLLGTVLAPDGKPFVGAKVELWRCEGRGLNQLDLAYANDYRRIAATVSDRNGRFALQLPVGLPCRLVVDAAPHALWRADDCLPNDDLTVQLCAGAIVAGELQLADGSPVPAQVRAWHRDTHVEVLSGRTDDAGRFRFERVMPGPLRVEIAPDHAPAPAWIDADTTSGATWRYDQKLDAGVTLTGRVVDEQGQPIAGARIGEGWMLFRAVTSDADGRYRMRGYGTTTRREVHCTADGYVRKNAESPKANGDTATLDFTLARGNGATGRIVDEHGAPLADVYVQAFAFARDSPGGLFDLAAMRTDRDGRFDLRGLAPGRDHVLLVRRDGRATLTYALPGPAANGVAAIGDVPLPPTRVVRGVLNGEDGKPLANASVSLRGYNADRNRFAPDGALARGTPQGPYSGWGILDHYFGRRHARTDQHGRFAFGDVAAGEFRVVYGDARGQEITSAGVVVAAGADPEPIELPPR